MKRKIISAVVLLFFLTGCALLQKKGGEWEPGKPIAASKIKIAVVYINDPGTETSLYSYAHDVGIKEMQKAFSLTDEQIINKYNVLDTDELNVDATFRDCIAQGANVIFATSWGFGTVCERLAQEFPKVIFAHASGAKSNEANFTNYWGRIYQAWYLAGIAAGMKTESNKIGFVAAWGKTNAEVTCNVNAFALGVEWVNKDAQIVVDVTNTWYDPMGETNAARALIRAGCDVIAQNCDSANPQLEAQKALVFGVGYNSDMGVEAPGAVLTSVVWRWGVYYRTVMQSIIDGTFTTKPYYGGLADGMVDITPLADFASPLTAYEIVAARMMLTTNSFAVFQDVLKTNDGTVVGTDGERFPDEVIREGMNWYYHNVIQQ
ncbi:MAG: BMP family ABC transporter substrate-binding protein [Treponemataceae bacterium]|nr:MAG: BMP family ABC transporter substrate-binding protein [Treponemataceae bacterium]